MIHTYSGICANYACPGRCKPGFHSNGSLIRTWYFISQINPSRPFVWRKTESLSMICPHFQAGQANVTQWIIHRTHFVSRKVLIYYLHGLRYFGRKKDALSSKWRVCQWATFGPVTYVQLRSDKTRLNISSHGTTVTKHDDVIKWKHCPRYWPFVWEIHRSPVNFPHKGQWRGALMFSLICA